jgi:sugar O-acyltransferase (sialic acid O-acetyltransferase NeuD family)
VTNDQTLVVGIEKVVLMTKKVIYGAGGHARELLFQLQFEYGMSAVVAMVDDLKPDRTICGIDVVDYSRAVSKYHYCRWYIAVGDIMVRTRLLAKIRAQGIEEGTFISSGALVAPTAKIRSSTQVFSGTVISDNCEVAENVIINFNCVISHDVKVGANSTIAPNAAIAGHVAVGEGVWIGVGASISNGKANQPLCIGDRVVIGAGACVIDDIPSGQTVVGVPARSKESRRREQRTILCDATNCSAR